MRTWKKSFAVVALCFGISAANAGNVILENDYVRAAVDLERGGRITEFVDKTNGMELTADLPKSQCPQGSGLFSERVVAGSKQLRDFECGPWKLMENKATATGKEVVVSIDKDNIKIVKKFTLANNSSVLRADYEVTNSGTEDVVGRLWALGVVFPAGKQERLLFRYPDGGSRRLEFNVGARNESNHFLREPRESWGAVVNGKGVGAAFDIDYPLFDHFYSYHPADGLGLPTFEWFSREFRLRPLKQGMAEAVLHPEEKDPLKSYIYRSGWEVFPLSGLADVAGVANGFAVEFQPGAVRIASGIAAKNLVAELTSVSGASLGRWEFDAKPGKTVKLDFAGKAAAGTLSISGAGKTLARFEPSGAKASQAKETLFDPPLDAELSLGLDFKDVPVKWGKPAERKLKVLMLTPVKGDVESAELLRRFDYQAAHVTCNHPHVFTFDSSYMMAWTPRDPEKALAKYLEKDYDAMLIGGAVMWEQIPEKLRGKIIDKIKGGMGLVYVGVEARPDKLLALCQKTAAEPLDGGVPLASLPALSKLSNPAEVYALGMGKIVFLKYRLAPGGLLWRVGPRAFTPYAAEDTTLVDFPYWEYYLSIIGRCVRFAANAGPEVKIAGLTLDNDGVIKTTIENGGGKQDAVTLKLSVRDKRWTQEAEKSLELKLSGTSEVVAAKLDPACFGLSGERFVNASLERGGKVLDWFSVAKDMPPGRGLTQFAVITKTCDPDSPVKVNVAAGKQAADDRRNWQYRLSLVDAEGRKLAEHLEPVGNGDETEFSLTPEAPSLTAGCVASAELLADGKATDCREDHFTVKRHADREVDFLVYGVGEPGHWSRMLSLNKAKEIGFDAYVGDPLSVTAGCDVTNAITATNLRGMEYWPMQIFRLAVNAAALKEKNRKPCLRSPELAAQMRRDIPPLILQCAGFSLDYYFVGDENSLGYYTSPNDFCFSPSCLTGFRQCLKGKYETLEKLNSAWNSAYGAWDEVVPLTFEEAKNKSLWPSWVEHRVYMFGALPDAVAAERRIVRESAPHAGLAACGMGVPSIYNGFDWKHLLQSIDLMIAYVQNNGREIDMLRSFRKPGGRLGAWNGYLDSFEVTQNRIWQQLLNGFDIPSLFWLGLFLNYGDMTLDAKGVKMKELIATVKGRGVGRILTSARWKDSDFAMLYSNANLTVSHITALDSNVTPETYLADLAGWSMLLRNSGFQPPLVITPEDLANLSPEKTKALILPLAQALSDANVAAIQNYAQNGGIVIADARPGIMKDDGTRRTDGCVDKLFGVAPGKAGALNDKICLGGKVLPVMPAVGGLVPAGARSLAEAPAAKTFKAGTITIKEPAAAGSTPSLLLNGAGKGRAVYLNLLLSDYEEMAKSPAQSAAMAGMLREVLSRAGLKAAPASLPNGSEAVTYLDGDNVYVGLCRQVWSVPEDTKFSCPLPGKMYVYDVLKGKSLGVGDAVAGELAPGAAAVFACLPNQIADLAAEVKAGDGGVVDYTLKLSGERPGLAVKGLCRMDILRDGAVRYSRVLEADDKGRPGTWNFALNERSGKWLFRFTDLFAGKTVEKTVEAGR